MSQFFTKIVWISSFAFFGTVTFGQNQKIVAGQIAQMKVYNFQKTTILDDFTLISLDSVGIEGAPVYDFKIRNIASGFPDTWLSYQIVQSALGNPWPKMEIAAQPFNQFSANVVQFEENDPIFDYSSTYEWKKLESTQLFLLKKEHEAGVTQITAGVWSDSLPHYLAFRYFSQFYVDTLYGYLKLSVETDYQISMTHEFELAIQNPVLSSEFLTKKMEQLVIYPNPVTDNLSLKIVENADLAQIFDENGRILWSKTKPDAPNLTVETTHFPTGKYWLQVLKGNRKYLGSFVVNH
jgi:hypothetical protein